MATETARTGTIYALVDPTAPSWDRAVRYIGKTVQPIRTRPGRKGRAR